MPLKMCVCRWVGGVCVYLCHMCRCVCVRVFDSSRHWFILGVGCRCCFQVVAPTIQNPACQEQLVDSAKVVAKSVEGVMAMAQVSDLH